MKEQSIIGEPEDTIYYSNTEAHYWGRAPYFSERGIAPTFCKNFLPMNYNIHVLYNLGWGGGGERLLTQCT